jgi:hypothetical protein
MKNDLLYVLVFACAACVGAARGEDFNLTKLIETKASLYQTSFDDEKIPVPPWILNHGQWSAKGGAISGKMTESENHGANLSLMAELPESFVFSVNLMLGAKGESTISFAGSGQGCKLIVSGREMYFRMKAGKSGVAEVIDWKKLNLSPDKPHRLDFIRHGDALMAVVDSKHVIYGRHEKIAMDKKRVVIGVSSPAIQIDRVNLNVIETQKAWPDYVQKNFKPKSWTLEEFWKMREKQGLKREVK